jgi:hypothetical protein
MKLNTLYYVLDMGKKKQYIDVFKFIRALVIIGCVSGLLTSIVLAILK